MQSKQAATAEIMNLAFSRRQDARGFIQELCSLANMPNERASVMLAQLGGAPEASPKEGAEKKQLEAARKLVEADRAELDDARKKLEQDTTATRQQLEVDRAEVAAARKKLELDRAELAELSKIAPPPADSRSKK